MPNSVVVLRNAFTDMSNNHQPITPDNILWNENYHEIFISQIQIMHGIKKILFSA